MAKVINKGRSKAAKLRKKQKQQVKEGLIPEKNGNDNKKAGKNGTA